MELETTTEAVSEVAVHNKTNEIVENGESPETSQQDEEFATPTASAPTAAPTPSSTPELTPSRRSSRKKQSTFSSDFEYYTPGGRKIVAADEDKQDVSAPTNKLTPKAGKNAQIGETNNAEESSEKGGAMQRKVAIRTKKGTGSKPEETNDMEDDEASPSSPKPKPNKTKPKLTVMKQKGVVGRKKKMAQQSRDDSKDKRTKLNRTLKRKKAAIKTALVKGKKAKLEKKKVEEETSEEDEEESTPISQLKAQMAASKTSSSNVSARVKQLANSPLAKNLMHKLKQVSGEVLSSPETLELVKKRKRAESKDTDDGEDNIPLKKLMAADSKKEEDSVKKEPAGGLTKRFPPEDMGLVKRTPSEIAAKLGPTSKTDHPSEVKDINQKTSTAQPGKTIKQEEDGRDESPLAKSQAHKEGQIRTKEEDSAAKKVKKEVKTEKSKVKEEVEKDSHTKTQLKGTKIKKETDVIKTIKKTITTSNGRVVNGVVKVYRNGKKVMIVNGKEKVLNLGKSKEKASHSKGVNKNDSQPKTKSSEVVVTPRKDGEKSKEENKAQSKGDKKKSIETKHKSGQNVDDLLKRGPIVKKKSHQPFGNKNTISKHHKLPPDATGETTVKSSNAEKKTTPSKGDDKRERKKSQEGERKKGVSAEKRRRSSSESSKSHPGRERSHSNDSSKAERKKSVDSGKKVVIGPKEEETKEEDLPALVPISALGKLPKHKHPKPEHEVPMDMTMNDLFKPDGLIVLDTVKKEENATAPGEAKKAGHDPDSPVKPQNLPNVLIEHRYSKPSSPVQNENGDNLSVGLRQHDFDSVSHPTSSVAVDANLPDQFMEECAGQDIETMTVSHPIMPDDTVDLQHSVNKEKIGSGGRISILESLDTELKEGGPDFVIVGQVEIERHVAAKRNEGELQAVAASSNHSEPREKEPSMAPTKSDESKSKPTTPSKEHKIRKDSGEFKRKEKHKDSKTADEEEEGEEEEEGFVDDENDDDWEPNDSNTLYCICQKPHGNRFMICCDKCEEWYHGSCVGISKARGKEMEDNEEEYICLVCQKGETTPTKTVDVSSTKSTEKSSSDKYKLLQKCVGRKCSKTPRPGSVYCSNECIMSHAQESLKVIREEQHKKKIHEKLKQTSSKDSKPSSSSSSSKTSTSVGDTVAVVETETGRIIQGSDAPSHKNLRQWLEDHPTFQVLHGNKQRSSSSSSKDKRRDSHSSKSGDKDKHHERDTKSFYGDKSRRDSKESAKKVDGEKRRSSSSSSKSENSSSTSSSSKSGDRNEDGPNQVRLNVRTALRDSLSARANDADDIMLSSTEIKNLALTIEEELFTFFGDTGHKYKTKYRSLIFNIKDHKNKGLFRKILTGKIKPSKLVQMSTEELASRELARWREKESKHQLQMIEQTEKEALKDSKVSKNVRKKTHKGEIEVEEEDLSILESHIEEKKDGNGETTEENIQIPVVDTTDQHRAHLFDLNCKVCTGKIVPGPEEQAVAKKQVTFSLQASSTRIISDDEQPAEQNDFDKAEEIVREAMRTVQKTAAEVASSSMSPPPKSEELSISPKPIPPLSPTNTSTRRGSTSSTSSSSSSISSGKKVVVRSPDSALQSGLEVKAKFTPTGPLLWKGFVSMLDVAKFFTSAYRVSGPTEHITIPDTIHIMGRISPDHMWDYLSKIRQAGSKDLTVLRFIPGSDDEKVAYVHLYSYLNSRSRCGVANNPNKKIKDFYVVPLASHSKIPRTLLPFDGPGLEENRPHMLIGIIVQQRGKHGTSDPEPSSKSSGSSPSVKTSNNHKSSKSSSSNSSSGSNSSSSTKKAVVNRDPRLAKLAAKKEAAAQKSPTASSSNSNSTSSSQVVTPVVATEEKAQVQEEEIYEPEYVPMPVKAKAEPVVEYVPTVKKKDSEGSSTDKNEKNPEEEDDKHYHHYHHHHHHHHHHPHHRHSHNQHHQSHSSHPSKMEDDSEPYSPGKEAEPYSPSREAEADEPYDPGDESLMDETGVPITSPSTAATTAKPISSNITASNTSTTTTSASTTTTTSTNETTPTNSSVSASQAEGETASSSKDSPKAVLPIPATGSFSIDECVEKMACSNNPGEISSLMVAALSTASTPEEQQVLLVDLTKRVEERKIQLAQMTRKGDGAGPSPPSKKLLEEGSVSSTSTVVESSSPPAPTDISQPVGSGPEKGVASSSSSKGIFSVSSSTEATLSKNLAPMDGLQTDQKQVNSESTFETSSLLVSSTSLTKLQLESSLSALTKSQSVGDKHSSDAKVTMSEDQLQQEAQHSPKEQPSSEQFPFVKPLQESPKPAGTDIPVALKALMDDVRGNTESFSLESCRKMLPKREAERSGGEAEIMTEVKSAVETFMKLPPEESQSSEAQRKIQDELEARKILEELNESEKAIGLPGGAKKEGGAPQPEGGKELTSSDKVPTIDELLEKLKKEGFKFPIDRSATAPSSSPSTAIVSSSEMSKLTTISETPPLPSSTTDMKCVDSSLDVDLRTSSALSSLTKPTRIPTPTLLPIPTPSDTMSMTISTSLTDSLSLPLQDSDQRKKGPLGVSGPGEQDQDAQSLYQDRDERAFQLKPKHPLDSRTFPPLVGDSQSGSPHPSDQVNLPLHQNAPQQADPFPPRPLVPRGRAQPPPPGTEPEEHSEPADVDMRSMGGPLTPMPPEQAPPPLPPQPPPPLPPMPGNRRDLHPPPMRDFPHYPSHELPVSDVDFRNHEHHHPPHPTPAPHHHQHPHPPPPHHHAPHNPPRHPQPHHSDGWYHDRGRGDSDYRGYRSRGRGGPPPFRRH